MKRIGQIVGSLLWVGLVQVNLGCGPSTHEGPNVEPSMQAQDKVKAMQRLADAMAKDANGPAAKMALEEFRNTAFDARAFPKEAGDIMAIYNQHIKGKYRGEVAQLVQIEVASVEAGLKQAK